jgi:hypothetical protein
MGFQLVSEESGETGSISEGPTPRVWFTADWNPFLIEL